MRSLITVVFWLAALSSMVTGALLLKIVFHDTTAIGVLLFIAVCVALGAIPKRRRNGEA